MPAFMVAPGLYERNQTIYLKQKRPPIYQCSLELQSTTIYFSYPISRVEIIWNQKSQASNCASSSGSSFFPGPKMFSRPSRSSVVLQEREAMVREVSARTNAIRKHYLVYPGLAFGAKHDSNDSHMFG